MALSFVVVAFKTHFEKNKVVLMFCLEEGHHKSPNDGKYHVEVLPKCGVQCYNLTMYVSNSCNNWLCIKINWPRIDENKKLCNY